MTVEAEWLGDLIALILGRDPQTAPIAELADVLHLREEVLPWLVLRQGAFADDPEICAVLKRLAATVIRPSRHRPDGPVMAPETQGLERDGEAALRELVAENVAGSATTDTIGAILHAHNRSLPGRPGYDFRRRIVERAPAPEPDPVPESGAVTQAM